jgi:hypothetical protein
MNKSQRAGIYGAIENTLDDLRHTWERLWFGNEVTGEVNVFTTETMAYSCSADELYPNTCRPDPSDGRGLEQEPPEIER